MTKSKRRNLYRTLAEVLHKDTNPSLEAMRYGFIVPKSDKSLYIGSLIFAGFSLDRAITIAKMI